MLFILITYFFGTLLSFVPKAMFIHLALVLLCLQYFMSVTPRPKHRTTAARAAWRKRRGISFEFELVLSKPRNALPYPGQEHRARTTTPRSRRRAELSPIGCTGPAPAPPLPLPR